jgi:tRNA(adenine34) deaminase
LISSGTSSDAILSIMPVGVTVTPYREICMSHFAKLVPHKERLDKSFRTMLHNMADACHFFRHTTGNFTGGYRIQDLIIRDDDYWMGIALREAQKAADRGEVPIGALVVKDNMILGRGYNLREASRDPVAHAEIIAIRKAAKKEVSWRLTGATVYVTLEPCIMCMGAMLLARIDRLVFGCRDPKGGAAGSLYDLSDDHRLNHRISVTSGVRDEECAAILSDFFAALRREKKKG